MARKEFRLLYTQSDRYERMSWSNPSPSEAAEMYSYYKHKYENAANQKRASERLEQSYISQRSSASSQLNNAKAQKVNLEKRLEGVEKIIKMLEGTGGWFSTNVPNAIQTAKNKLKQADNSYRSSIKVTGGIAAASIESAFATKAVEEDANSANALNEFKKERTRLEQAISELNSQINNLAATIANLTSSINACNETQASLQSAMNSYAYDMNHYHGFMY